MVDWTGGRTIEQLEAQMLRLVTAAVVAIAVLGTAASASAADDDHYDGLYAPGVAVPMQRVQIYRGPPLVQGQYAPPVYGWVIIRPSSCGKYRYWKGLRCVDARYRPPYVGPKW